MHDRSIAWMMSGGNRFETAEERLDHLHARALRDARAKATTPARTLTSFSLRTTAVAALAAVGIGSATPDCCVA